MLKDSGLIDFDVAHYMFGYCIIKFTDDKEFWSDLDRDTIYWSVLRGFSDRMKLAEKSFRFQSGAIRF